MTVRGRPREQDDNTEDGRQTQRARFQGDEPAEDVGESEARATARKPNDFAKEEDAAVMNAMIATADPIPIRAGEWQGHTQTQASLTTQPAAAVGE